MSLNQLTSDKEKNWLNIRVNSLKLNNDNKFTSKTENNGNDSIIIHEFESEPNCAYLINVNTIAKGQSPADINVIGTVISINDNGSGFDNSGGASIYSGGSLTGYSIILAASYPNIQILADESNGNSVNANHVLEIIKL